MVEKGDRIWCFFSDKYLVGCLHQSLVFNAVAMGRHYTVYMCGHITFPSTTTVLFAFVDMYMCG